jgi:hypothetical protein
MLKCFDRDMLSIVLYLTPQINKHVQRDRNPKSLADKLGIKGSLKTAVIKSPAGYVKRLGDDIGEICSTASKNGSYDLVQYFTVKRDDLEEEFPMLNRMLLNRGFLWISWPKLSSCVETDLNENEVREIGLENGLVDVKVVSIDEIWSALKFVHRKKKKL